MERLLVIWYPELTEEQEDGRGARAFAQALELVSTFSPAVEVVRPGMCALATRGPARYFGGEENLARQLVEVLTDPEHPMRKGPMEIGPMGIGPVQIGIADGLFAAMVAARVATDGPQMVTAGATPAFLSRCPVDVLERPELADLLRRLGIRTLGEFAALPTRHVLARLGADAVACHVVARGVNGELDGLRAPRRTQPGQAADRARPRQPGFWGTAAAAEVRADAAAARAVALVHPEAVVVGRIQGGRGPAERARLVPWAGRRLEAAATGPEPWPGRIPSPSPVVVFDRPLPAVLLDAAGDVVGVSASGVLSAAPARLSVSGGRWTAITAWAGPWPADERWWSGRARRRKARMQLVTETGAAYLLVRERGGWWVEGAYD